MLDIASIAAALPSERELRLAEFGERMTAWRGRRLGLFGTGANAAGVLERYGSEFDFVSCSDEGGEMVAGRQAAALSAALASGLDAVVLAAKVSSLEPVYERVAPKCLAAGVAVLDLYGCDEAELRRLRDERMAAGFEKLMDALASYDVLSIDDDDFSAVDLAERCLIDAGPNWHMPGWRGAEAYPYQALLGAAVERGMRVALVCDATERRELIECALEQRGLLDAVTLVDARACGRAKENGLFRALSAAYPGARILHVGDEPFRDGVVPQLFDVDAWVLPDAEPSPYVEDAPCKGVLPADLTEAEQVLVELSTRGPRDGGSALRRYAFSGLGPLVCAFTQWLAQSVSELRPDQVLFAARDGWVLQQAYDRYRAHHPHLRLAPSTYLHASRKAAALPLLGCANAWAHFAQSCEGMTPSEMLAGVFDAAGAAVADDSPTADARLAALLANRDLVEARAARARDEWQAYAQVMGLASEGRYAFVDFVAAGTTQHLMAEYASFGLLGLYAARRPEPGAYDLGDVRAFFGTDSHLVRTFMRHEAFFSSPEPPVDGYTAARGGVVFAAEQRPRRDIEALATAHREILSFAASYFADPRSERGPVRWEVADALLARYDEAETGMAILDSWTGRPQTEGFGFGGISRRTARDVLLGLLREFDAVCERHGLTYCAVHGTLLGAVRHGGFVPGDDDIDVAMPRADFEKLVSLPASEFSDPYFLQTVMSDPGCFYGGYAKLRDSSTTALEQRNVLSDCNQGMWMDILPLDYCGATQEDVDKQQRRVMHWQRMLFAQTYPSVMNPIADANPKKMSAYYIAAGLMGREVLAGHLRAACTAHRQSFDLTIFACYYPWIKNRNRFPAADLADLERVPFEDVTIPAPRNRESWLEARYGADWRVQPERSADHAHADVEIDTATPYREALAGKGGRR